MGRTKWGNQSGSFKIQVVPSFFPPTRKTFQIGGITMRRSTRNKAEGKFHEVKGKMMEKAGKLIKKPKLQMEGQDEKLAGHAQNIIGKVEDVLGA